MSQDRRTMVWEWFSYPPKHRFFDYSDTLLAHEILRRYHGQVTFRQENAREASDNLDEGFIQLMDGHIHYNGDRQSLRPSK